MLWHGFLVGGLRAFYHIFETTRTPCLRETPLLQAHDADMPVVFGKGDRHLLGIPHSVHPPSPPVMELSRNQLRSVHGSAGGPMSSCRDVYSGEYWWQV
jgi:hypothetical protein